VVCAADHAIGAPSFVTVVSRSLVVTAHPATSTSVPVDFGASGTAASSTTAGIEVSSYAT
jgi:hypothetical protein